MNAALACTLAAVLLLCATSACAVPTLAQRQQAWRDHVKAQRLVCISGLSDPAMPEDVREYCARVVER